MITKPTKYIRKGSVIREIDGGNETQYASINQAKKASREIQLREDNHMGRGSLQVEKRGVR